MSDSEHSSNSGPHTHYTVPVVTDGLTREGPAPHLARCVYFTIEADGPNSEWTLGLPIASVPFLMLGLQGIVYRPMRPDRAHFISPTDWDELVDFIEQINGLTLECGYFWFPVKLLDLARSLSPAAEGFQSQSAARGEVFRISSDLFAMAMKAARNGTDFGRFEKDALGAVDGDQLGSAVKYSPEETKSIQEWSVSQVARAGIV